MVLNTKMKNKKTLKKLALFLVIIFAGFNINIKTIRANGCCILDTRKTTVDSANCKKNSVSADCRGTNQSFLDKDVECNKAISVSYCGVPSPNDIGCCILNASSDTSKYGPANCLSNKKRSECGGIFESTISDCNTLNSKFCQASANGSIITTTTTFINPLGNVTTVSGLVGNILNNLKGIIASIAILFIVVGGLMYILSAGNDKMITTAKNTIASALIGLAIALAAPTFLKEIINILGNGNGADAQELVSQALTLKEIIMKVLAFLLSIVGILAMIGLIIGGAFYLTAYGDDDRIKTGKGIITNSLIGILVVMAALVIVKQIASLLGVSG